MRGDGQKHPSKRRRMNGADQPEHQVEATVPPSDAVVKPGGEETDGESPAAANLEVDAVPMALHVLDVGSCYNPFGADGRSQLGVGLEPKLASLDQRLHVLPIDIAPALPAVYVGCVHHLDSLVSLALIRWCYKVIVESRLTTESRILFFFFLTRSGGGSLFEDLMQRVSDASCTHCCW